MQAPERTELRAEALAAGGVLIALSGLPGTGKSRVARFFEALLGAQIAATAAARAELFPAEWVPAHLRLGDAATRATYAVTEARAEAALRRGASVVLDGSYLRASDRARVTRWVSRLARPCLWLEVIAPEPVILARLEARTGPGDILLYRQLAARVAAGEADWVPFSDWPERRQLAFAVLDGVSELSVERRCAPDSLEARLVAAYDSA